MAKTHPHIDQPTLEQLAALVADRSQEVRDTYLRLHQLVTETLPEAKFAVDESDAQIGYGAKQFGYDGWGMTVVTPYTKWVSLFLTKGADLNDPNGILGGTSKTMRSVKFTKPEDVSDLGPALTDLLQQATAGPKK